MSDSNGTKLVKLGQKDLRTKGSAWATAGLMVIASNAFDHKEQKAQAKAFNDHWAADIDPACLPTGKATNRNGEKFDLLKDDGSIKLSQWDATMAGSKAMNEMTKLTRTYADMVPEGDDSPRGLEAAVEVFFPKGIALSGRKMRTLIGKIKSDPMQIIERALTAIEDALPKVDLADTARVHATYARATIAFSETIARTAPVAKAA